MDGICTLANDRVYDQLVALLNSIEAIYGQKMPVCVYPYDNNTEKIAAEVASRPQVQLYDDKESIHRWDKFAANVWDTHPTAFLRWQKISRSIGYHRFGTHRRYCAFDGPFERFLYMDADTLLQSSVDGIFHRLAEKDFIVYDFQYKHTRHVYEASSDEQMYKLLQMFSQSEIDQKIFCSGFYASKKGLFSPDKLDWLLAQLSAGEAQVLYCMAPDQTILNYMVMRSQISISNLALELPASELTGCCVTSSHFQAKDNILYDKGKQLTYIHYIGLSSQLFARLCAGENIDFPYRDIFLHNRYLYEPAKRPKFSTKAKPYNAPPGLGERILRKFGRLKVKS